MASALFIHIFQLCLQLYPSPIYFPTTYAPISSTPYNSFAAFILEPTILCAATVQLVVAHSPVMLSALFHAVDMSLFSIRNAHPSKRHFWVALSLSLVCHYNISHLSRFRALYFVLFCGKCVKNLFKINILKKDLNWLATMSFARIRVSFFSLWPNFLEFSFSKIFQWTFFPIFSGNALIKYSTHIPCASFILVAVIAIALGHVLLHIWRVESWCYFFFLPFW